MLRLQTFGGLTLSRGNENLTGAVTQRRRLAILVLLAVAGEAGMSRDKLVAYLWPESDAARARHVLNQLLYAQRRQVSDQSLFVGQKTLRLNSAVIWTDAGAFEQAMAADDPGGAVSLYRGPFLDGFFMKDAPEFDRWVEDQRSRFGRRVTSACARLAGNAAEVGRHREAADWWAKASEVDPYDTGLAIGLVRALAAAGDRAGAFLAARRHEDLLRRDLGVAPDAAFAQLLTQLR